MTTTTIPTTMVHNIISLVAESFSDSAEPLEALVQVCRMLGVETGSHSMLTLGDYIEERVEVLQEDEDEDEELDDDGIFEAFLDDGGEEEDFVVFHFGDASVECDDECCGCHNDTTDIHIMFDDDVDPDAFDYGMSEDADGTIVLTETLTRQVMIDEIDVLSKKGKEKVRFIIIDAEDGELIDANDGKGYKTRAKAENALWSDWIGGE